MPVCEVGQGTEKVRENENQRACKQETETSLQGKCKISQALITTAKGVI